MHNLFQAWTLASKLIDGIVLSLQCVLQIIDHSLLDLLKLFNARFISLSDSVMLLGLLNMLIRCTLVIVLAIVLFVFLSISAHIKGVIGLLDSHHLLIMLSLESLISYILRLIFKLLSRIVVHFQYMILMGLDTGDIGLSSFIIGIALLLFSNLKVLFVPIHHISISITALGDIVSKFGVLLRDPYLFLQPLLFVVKLA